jgi:hypothetical protein
MARRGREKMNVGREMLVTAFGIALAGMSSGRGWYLSAPSKFSSCSTSSSGSPVLSHR